MRGKEVAEGCGGEQEAHDCRPQATVQRAEGNSTKAQDPGGLSTQRQLEAKSYKQRHQQDRDAIADDKRFLKPSLETRLRVIDFHISCSPLRFHRSPE